MLEIRRPYPHSTLALACVLSCALAGCRREAPRSEPSPPPVVSAPKPIDRLGAGELAAGAGDVFGLPVPQGMTVVGRAPDSAVLVGDVTPDAVTKYVRDYVLVSHVEMSPQGTVFPKAVIKGGPADRFFQIEVVPEQRMTRLSVRDITPAPPVPGLTDQERWRRAGFSADRRPLDAKSLE